MDQQRSKYEKFQEKMINKKEKLNKQIKIKHVKKEINLSNETQLNEPEIDE